jgi:hypothetical protein
MSRKARPKTASVTRKEIRVDFNTLRETAYLGVRRAAAFLGIGLNTTEEYIPQSLTLTTLSMWRFFPEPLPEESGREAVKEFRIWLIGNALRELDTHFSLFLDNTCFAVRLSKLHGTRVKTDHIIKSIAAETNVSKKYSIVMNELGEKEAEASMLWSLSNARNCLTHNAGIVSDRHANVGGSLEIRWLGLEARLPDREMPVVLPPVFDKPVKINKGERIEIATIERSKHFALGEKIQLTPNELHEICVYYLCLADQVVEKFAADLAARGVVAEEIPSRLRPAE